MYIPVKTDRILPDLVMSRPISCAPHSQQTGISDEDYHRSEEMQESCQNRRESLALTCRENTDLYTYVMADDVNRNGNGIDTEMLWKLGHVSTVFI